MSMDSLEYRALLTALGFAPQQIVRLLEQGVTIDQLRGMWQLRQCEGAPTALLAEMAARIDRLEQAEKLPLDSHTA
jgi:hypothetical protein